MFDFADDDHITVVLPVNLHSDTHNLPSWFLKILSDIVAYYTLPVPYEDIIKDRTLLEAYLTKRGFEFEYFNFDNFSRIDYNSWTKESIYHCGYVFKSTPELSAYILTVKEHTNEH